MPFGNFVQPGSLNFSYRFVAFKHCFLTSHLHSENIKGATQPVRIGKVNARHIDLLSGGKNTPVYSIEQRRNRSECKIREKHDGTCDKNMLSRIMDSLFDGNSKVVHGVSTEPKHAALFNENTRLVN